ncbi:hypothetical protein GGX14DRAFT_605037, partial [Mycena pura]
NILGPVASACKTTTTKGCNHACCDLTVRPPRASTEMLRLRRLVKYFQLKAREITQYLNVKRCLLSPIRRLPPELLSMVFAFAVLTPNPVRVLTMSATVTAIRLAHVCNYWRIIMLDTSKLWATILIHYEPQAGGRAGAQGKRLRVAQVDFHALHAKARQLTIHVCPWHVRRPLLFALMRLSLRWRALTLVVDSVTLDDLDTVARRVPLLASVSIYHDDRTRDGSQMSGAFAHAPALRRFLFHASVGYIWPARIFLPWVQLTSLTLSPISLTTFTECIQHCARLLFFAATVAPAIGDPEVLPPPQLPEARGAGTRRPLHTLLLWGSICQDALALALLAPPHFFVFPHLRLLSLNMNGLHPELYSVLARCCRLEMLVIYAWSQAEMEDVLPLLLAAPTLRIVHFRDCRMALVTPRLFTTPLVVPVSEAELEGREAENGTEPRWQSFTELGIEEFASYPDTELHALLRSRHSVEAARLHLDGPYDAEEELEHLFYK